MTPEMIQLGGLFIIAFSLVEAIKFIVAKYTKNGNGKVEDTLKGLLNQVEIANSNHLDHIYKEQEKQTRQGEQQISLLTKICAILDERKPR